MKLPFYEEPANPKFALAANVNLHILEMVAFLRWIVKREQLEVAEYLPEMDDTSFFLVAATGLGKTVAVPPHVLIRQMQRAGARQKPRPRVWVVEPRIPIAVDQAKYMNSLWSDFRRNHSRHKATNGFTPPLFGSITSNGKVNPSAPIQFVTTGIFESQARNGQFDSINDRVIIDEAHVTVEQNPGVELGIALCRKANITIDYMSATVDVTGLESALGVAKIIRADKSRNIIWKSNLQEPMERVLSSLVEGTLINPDPTSSYFPQPDDFSQAIEVSTSATEPGRSHGMLIVVNSFNGQSSDISRLTALLRKSHSQLPVLHLASEVVRDPRREVAFKRQLAKIEASGQNYVIMATSVVEMGITFPTLDYVVTMDSGYEQETIGDISFPVVSPLGVNSLLQRIGRVGRRRPGIAYISNEVGAEYALIDDRALNSGRLACEPIRYPYRHSPLMPLAYYAATQEWTDLETWLAELHLPSQLHENPDRMEFLREQFTKLRELGMVHENKLTPLGISMEQWIGQADLAYASHLQRRLAEGASKEELLFWAVSTALSNQPLATLRARYGYFIDYDETHKKTANRIHVWEADHTHEDIALFQMLAYVAAVAPGYLWCEGMVNDVHNMAFAKWCNWAGLDGRKLLKARNAIIDTLKQFACINYESVEFRKLFGVSRTINTQTINWQATYEGLPLSDLRKQLDDLSGVTTIKLSQNKKIDGYEWVDLTHGHEGLIRQDETPLRLRDGAHFTARATPSRQAKDDETSWRIAGLGVVVSSPQAPMITSSFRPAQRPPVDDVVEVPRAEPQSQSVPVPIAAQPAKKKGFWTKLFGG